MNVLEWPRQGPNINPTKNLQQVLQNWNSQTLLIVELIEVELFCNEEWKKISAIICIKQVETYSEWLAAIIARCGLHSIGSGSQSTKVCSTVWIYLCSRHVGLTLKNQTKSGHCVSQCIQVIYGVFMYQKPQAGRIKQIHSTIIRY